MKTILIIDDDTNLCYSLSRTLSEDYHVLTAHDTREAFGVLAGTQECHLIILDLKLGEENGLHVLERLKKDFPTIPVVMLTAYGESDVIMQSVQIGAEDFLVKPVDLSELIECIERYSLNLSSQCDNDSIPVPLPEQLESAYIGVSRASRDVLKLIAAVAPTNTPVLITGESGTGKEKVAEMLHSYSHRTDGPFVIVNCAAIPSDLLESELFGHVKGAFSGAVQNKTGLFEKAHTGTLFLDEIGELPFELQAKLLRVLQNGKIQKLGSTEYADTDVRVIAATNRNIQEEVENDQFREDLFYRLNGFNIHIPPLRDRKKDIQPLAMYFIRQFADEFSKSVCCVEEQIFPLLEKHPWPGNIRELQNVIKKALILASQNKLVIDNFKLNTSVVTNNEMTKVSLLDYCSNVFNNNLHQSVEWLEKELIIQALAVHHHHLSKTAESLGITRVTLNAKIEKYKLKFHTIS